MGIFRKCIDFLLVVTLSGSFLMGCASSGIESAVLSSEEGLPEAASTAEGTASEESTEEISTSDISEKEVFGGTEELPAIEAIDSEQPVESEETVEKTGDIIILFTSDMHCGIDQGFGLAGLYEIKKNYEKNGYETILVDNGDAVQGEIIGIMTKGEAMIELMNDVGYDVAIPGNHEFDYGMDRFLELTKKADFPYISCNFNKEGKLIFEPYIIKPAAGLNIGFVGVTTPNTLTTSTPKFFQNEEGEFIYGFMQDEDGEAIIKAVQDSVDSVIAKGADFVYVIGHLGMNERLSPVLYSDIIANTNGIDVFLDGHSHDTEQVFMKNKDGKEVIRCAPGTKLNCIGFSHISPEGEIVETGLWSWPNKDSVKSLLTVDNEIQRKVEKILASLDEKLKTVVAKAEVELTINDPAAKDTSGNPIRMVRRAETNIGDFLADAFKEQSGADIAFINGGSIRDSIDKGDITNEDLLKVFPFGNSMTVIEVTGQQVLDALEWGSRAVPGENGGFLQVSGISCEIDVSIDSSCLQDENTMFKGVKGKRRVKNVKVGDEPIDPHKKYSLAGSDYTLEDMGDGHSMFSGAPLLQDSVKPDYEVVIDYVNDSFHGVIGEEYSDPYGQGRITILE